MITPDEADNGQRWLVRVRYSFRDTKILVGVLEEGDLGTWWLQAERWGWVGVKRQDLIAHIPDPE